MNALKAKDPNAKKGTLAQNIIDQKQATFTLGPASTSPLELTGAYAAVANDGTFCPPSPILSIKDANGRDQDVKRSPCAPQMSPQVARTAVQVLSGDTRAPGTSAAQFQNLYNANPGMTIAGKTGTVNASKPLTANADLWFAGVTPDLAATTALFNLDNPSKPISGIPNLPDDQAAHLTGEYAAGVWATALTPLLQGKQWAWQDPNQLANSTPVPPVVGQPYDTAKQTLTQAGFKVTKFPFDCGSSQPYGSVAYQSATNVAESGATITLCVSDNQHLPSEPPPPKPTIKKTPTGHPTGGHSTPGRPGGRSHTPPPRH
jgi:membrane peptidoglycan carboxypeptidase